MSVPLGVVDPATWLIACLTCSDSLTKWSASIREREEPNAQITQSLLVVGGFGLLISALTTTSCVPFNLTSNAPGIVRSVAAPTTRLYAVGFPGCSRVVGPNLMTDALFIGARSRKYNLCSTASSWAARSSSFRCLDRTRCLRHLCVGRAGGYLVAVVVRHPVHAPCLSLMRLAVVRVRSPSRS